MIPHHEGAVVMSKEMAGQTSRPELRSLAETIIKAQTDEIAKMQIWQAAWSKQ
jgi:uncharacterized protein (DUF305 family)